MGAVKSLFKIMVLIFAGVGMYYAGKNALVSWDPGRQESPEKIVKKVAPEKLKFKKENKTAPEPVKRETDFTFYEVLNDDRMVKFVGLDGKVHRGDRPLGLMRREEQMAPSKPLAVARQETVVKKPKAPEIAKAPIPEAKAIDEKSSTGAVFSLQVSSFRELKRAMDHVGQLQKKGYPAFSRSVTLDDSSVWNRVYIGPFEDSEKARGTMSAYSQKEGASAVLSSVGPETA
ncbi:MAG: hypothetical protein G3M78_12190 [Candidatus Nitrohelix vancouverensis]|uniref:SPOR domain-containing protein n=1 Tax=Candidatus Nitrohelix vancouverensis TaxID=2705534 RepID=A0A7T0C3Z2_9BACT|nr:MAG: hypothetical protein G3M78_12190 [Candidatus Nitrohelix vancouverensis]